MKTYTEDEIKEWFKLMKKKYPNSNMYQHLKDVEFMMFDKTFGNKNCLEKIKESYTIVFCDTNDVNTAFGTYNTYDTYETADHVIRMTWNKKREQRVNDGYKVGDAWVVIKKN